MLRSTTSAPSSPASRVSATGSTPTGISSSVGVHLIINVFSLPSRGQDDEDRKLQRQRYSCKKLNHGGADMIEKQNSEYKAKLCGGLDGELVAAMWQAALQRHEWRARSRMAGRPTDLRQRGRRARRSTAARPAVLRRFRGRTSCTGVRMHMCCTILGAHSPRIPQVRVELGRRWRRGRIICHLHTRSHEIMIAVLGWVATDAFNTFQGPCLSIWSHYKSCCRNYFFFATDWC